MREIKFRGKRINNGKWVYGYFLVNQFGEHTICDKTFAAAVIPETVGQFAGLHDRGSTDIFEGDILRSEFFQRSAKVEFIDGAYVVEANTSSGHTLVSWWCGRGMGVEVIGNIYENSELLEVE